MSSLLDQGKELTVDIMSQDVPHLREAVTQAVTSKEGRQSAVAEIWATIKGIWAKITESGLVSVVIEKVKTIVQKLVGGSNASGEGAPLLPTSGGNRGLVANLPSVPESLLAGAGGFMNSLPDAITDKIPSQIMDALPKAPEEVESGNTAPSFDVSALSKAAADSLAEAADPEIDVASVDLEGAVTAVAEEVDEVVPEAVTTVESVAEALPESDIETTLTEAASMDIEAVAHAVVEATEAVEAPVTVVEANSVVESASDFLEEAE